MILSRFSGKPLSSLEEILYTEEDLTLGTRVYVEKVIPRSTKYG